jgi:hypothetical protein
VSGGRRPAAPSSQSCPGALSVTTPAIRVVRIEEDRRSYSLPSASGDHVPAHRLPAAFSAPRMRTPLGPSRTSWSLHRTASTSDAPVVTRRHARPVSVLADALSAPRSSRMVRAEIDLRAEGPCFAVPVKARRAKAREHLPSYREPASRNPQAEPARTFYRERYSAYRFAFYPLVPASGSASSFLPASALALHKALRPSGGHDARCVRPTSAT